jgi:hypothetical protein
MIKKCKKYKNMRINRLASIEKWILEECYCNVCNQNTYLNGVLQSIQIQKEANIQLNELTLTSKMIVKIQMEIVKKCLLDTI